MNTVSLLTPSGRVTCWASHNTDLSSNRNKLYINQYLFQRVFNKLSNYTKVDRLPTCGSLVIDV